MFAPAFKESEIGELTDICEHLVFNSFSQLEKYADFCKEKGVSIGIRVNPECSTQATTRSTIPVRRDPDSA